MSRAASGECVRVCVRERPRGDQRVPGEGIAGSRKGQGAGAAHEQAHCVLQGGGDADRIGAAVGQRARYRERLSTAVIKGQRAGSVVDGQRIKGIGGVDGRRERRSGREIDASGVVVRRKCSRGPVGRVRPVRICEAASVPDRLGMNIQGEKRQEKKDCETGAEIHGRTGFCKWMAFTSRICRNLTNRNPLPINRSYTIGFNPFVIP